MFQATLAFLLLITSCTAFSIESAESNIGQVQALPARSGENSQSIELRCNLQFNPLEQWTRCTWSHNFPQIWAADNQEGFVMCSAHHQDDHERVCEDQGNLKDQYGYYNDPENNPYTQYDTDRLTHNVGEDYCGLTIRSPHANDTGLWKCHVNDNNPMGQSTTMWKEVEIFVANKSVPVITRPDPNDVSNSAIELDLSTSTSIDAECKAMFGSPPPKIIWYIDDIDNELDSSFSSDSTARDGTVTSSIRFDLDQQMLSRYRVKEENFFFAFALGCRPDQDNYFTEREDAIRNPAQVMVYGTSDASLPSLLSLPLALMAVILIL
jgi:hypothetical protein